MDKPDLKIEYRPISSLIPYVGNARTHSEEQVSQIAASIKEFGWTNPILVDGENGIIAGHGRLMAAQRMKIERVPVIELSGLSDAQRRAYILADNRLPLNAEWDMEMLASEIKGLHDEGFDLPILGFAEDELDDLLQSIDEEDGDGNADPEATPELPEIPVTVVGDIWILGNHRLMCGDSTSLFDAERLMADSLADLVFTDPPYNVDYSGRGNNNLGTIKNDNISAEEFEQFCRDVFTTYFSVMKPLACIYVCHPDSQSAPKLAFEKTFAEQFKKSSTIIWMKQSAGMGWQDYRAQHEPILYGWKESGKGSHFYCGDRSKTTLWQIGRDAQTSYVHPTQKPVALPEEAINNSSKGQDVIVDLFGGSWSTLIACERTGRQARLMELDPKYCDVIINRWQDYTGKKATLEADGRTFEEVKVEREAA